MIDILMATYNGSLYIEAQIASIIRQTCSEWRLIVGDDRSEDETATIVGRIADNYNRTVGTEKIQLYVNAQSCGGAAGNFLLLLQKAKAEYVMFSDQDDVWHPDKIKKSLDAMHTLEKLYGPETPLLVYTDLAVVDQGLRSMADSFFDYMKIPPVMYPERLLLQNSVTGCTVMINRALYLRLQRAEDTGRVLMHDHFAALIAVFLGQFIFVPEATIDYRQHGDNSIGAADARSLSYLWRRYRRGKKQFRRDLYNSMNQASYFYTLYQNELKNTQKGQLLLEYSGLSHKNKWTRISFYVKHRAIKYGFVRAVMQMIWG